MTTKARPTPKKNPTRLRRARKLLFGQEALTAWLFILPSLVGFVLFYALPAVRAARISFTEWNLLREPKAVGFENYVTLFNDPQFWNSMRVTGLYVLYNIPTQMVLGLLMALLMDRLTKSVLVRGVLILPYLISNVVVALVWLWMLDPLLGYVNAFFNLIGLERLPFFTSPELALPTIAGVNVWRHAGFSALLFYAGLQSIPKSLYEAATIDGANEWRLFRHITLPLLRPVTVFVLVTTIIGAFQIFDTVAVTTEGGPVNSTRVIVWYIFQNAFELFKMGYASALSVVLFLLLVTVTLLQMRLLRGGQSDLA